MRVFADAYLGIVFQGLNGSTSCHVFDDSSFWVNTRFLRKVSWDSLHAQRLATYFNQREAGLPRH